MIDAVSGIPMDFRPPERRGDLLTAQALRERVQALRDLAQALRYEADYFAKMANTEAVRAMRLPIGRGTPGPTAEMWGTYQPITGGGRKTATDAADALKRRGYFPECTTREAAAKQIRRWLDNMGKTIGKHEPGHGLGQFVEPDGLAYAFPRFTLEDANAFDYWLHACRCAGLLNR